MTAMSSTLCKDMARLRRDMDSVLIKDGRSSRSNNSNDKDSNNNSKPNHSNQNLQKDNNNISNKATIFWMKDIVR